MIRKLFKIVPIILCFTMGLYIGGRLNKVEIITNVIHHTVTNEIKEIINTKEIVKIREIINEFKAAELYEELKYSTVTVFTPRVGVGSGVIISEDGYILTCYHVTRPKRITGVAFTDLVAKPEDFIEVEVVATDPENDLAILKVNVDEELKPVKFADITKLKVGDPVIMIGTPKSQVKALSMGVISKINTIAYFPKMHKIKRRLIKGLILVDIGVNPGNSGGGLFTMNGELIGTVSLKGGDNHMIIIPVDKAKKLIEEVIK